MNLKFFFSDPRMAWFWLVVRLYVGWQWLSAGWGKLNSPEWIGGSSGTALSGFVQGALAKTVGAHPDVSAWYGFFLQHVVLPHTFLWSHLITFGELCVGLGLVLGAFTCLAAFFGFFMNLNYLFAGAVSINPTLLVLSLGIMFAWRVAGRIGVDGMFAFYKKSRSLSA